MLSIVIAVTLIYSVKSVSHHKNFTQDNSEFLFQHPKLCGDPFADPIWIPVLDLCTVKCDTMTTYCVENEELKQQCKPLPHDCQKMLKLRALRHRQRSRLVQRTLRYRPKQSIHIGTILPQHDQAPTTAFPKLLDQRAIDALSNLRKRKPTVRQHTASTTTTSTTIEPTQKSLEDSIIDDFFNDGMEFDQTTTITPITTTVNINAINRRSKARRHSNSMKRRRSYAPRRHHSAQPRSVRRHNSHTETI